MSSNQDLVLWNAFRQGDKGAFERLYQEYYTVLYHYGHSITADTDIVRDSIQTLFIDLWRRRTHLCATDQIKPYLYRGLRRLLIKNSQKQREFSLQKGYPDPPLPSPEERTIVLETADSQRRRIKEAIQTLTPKQREVVHLRFYENLDNQAIATLMGVTVNTVYNLASLAISRLRFHLKSRKELFCLVKLILILITVHASVGSSNGTVHASEGGLPVSLLAASESVLSEGKDQSAPSLEGIHPETVSTLPVKSRFQLYRTSNTSGCFLRISLFQ